MSIEISVMIIAICLVLLVFVGLILMIFVIKSLKKVDQAVTSFEVRLHPLIHEGTRILNTTNEITALVKHQIEKVDPLFSSISKTGHLMENFLEKVRGSDRTNSFVNFQESKQTSAVIDWAEWISLGIIVWQKIRKRI